MYIWFRKQKAICRGARRCWPCCSAPRVLPASPLVVLPFLYRKEHWDNGPDGGRPLSVHLVKSIQRPFLACLPLTERGLKQHFRRSTMGPAMIIQCHIWREGSVLTAWHWVIAFLKTKHSISHLILNVTLPSDYLLWWLIQAVPRHKCKRTVKC